MDVIPGEEPSSGPNYWNFDPNVLYKFSVDNNGDGKADDVELEFRFKTEPIRGIAGQLTLPLSYVGGAGGLPPITALDGPGSEGLGLRQRYSVTLVRGHHRTQVANGLIAVPSNVGPRTMPDYASLAAQGTYDLGNGIKVFAGQREDPFYIDLGGVFDTLNLRRVPPIETPAEDANDNVNPFGTDMLSGFNVHSIAIELPASMLTGDTGATTIGGYASTSRPHVEVDGDGHGGFRQVQRLANPLVNEAIIGTVDKDRWNSLEPDQESRFEDYYLNPRLALAMELVFGVPAAKTNRTDLRDLLLKYQPSDTAALGAPAAEPARPAHAVRGSEADDGPRGHARSGPAPAAGRAARGDRARLLRRPHPVRARRAPRPAARDDQEPHVRRPPARCASCSQRPGSTRRAVAFAASHGRGRTDASRDGTSSAIGAWSSEELKTVLDLADELKAAREQREPHELLPGRTLGMIFQKPSTRTRVSFEVGIVELGGYGALPRRERPPARARRDDPRHGARPLALPGRDHDPDLRAGGRRGARRARVDPGHQRADRRRASVPGARRR